MSVFLTVLITNLHDATSNNLNEVFGNGVAQAEVPIRYIKNSFKHMPYGFVTFTDDYYLNLALARIPPIINGHQVKIKHVKIWPEVEDTLKVTQLPPGITSGQIISFFKNYDPLRAKIVNGYALVKFETKNDRDAAIIELNGKPWRGINVNIEWSNESLV